MQDCSQGLVPTGSRLKAPPHACITRSTIDKTEDRDDDGDGGGGDDASVGRISSMLTPQDTTERDHVLVQVAIHPPTPSTDRPTTWCSECAARWLCKGGGPCGRVRLRNKSFPLSHAHPHDETMKRQQQSKRERAFCSTIEMSSRHDARVERLRKTQVAQAESLDAMASASGASPDKEGLQEDAPKAQPRLSKATRTMGSLMFKARRSTAGPVTQPLATQLSTEGAQPDKDRIGRHVGRATNH